MTMRAIALLVSMSLGACSTTATIHRVYGPSYEAEIADSDASALRVLGDDGRLHAVPRAEVTDVDHPGNVVLTVGAVLTAIGALVAISIMNDGTPSMPADRDDATAIGMVYGVPGVVMMALGGVAYITSKSRASAFEAGRFPTLSRPPPVRHLPPLPPPPPAPAPAPPAPAPPSPPPADEPQVVPEPAAESPR